jgi:hypothetical protein
MRRDPATPRQPVEAYGAAAEAGIDSRLVLMPTDFAGLLDTPGSGRRYAYVFPRIYLADGGSIITI